MSLNFVEAIPSKDRLTQSFCPFHRERLAEGCRPESEKVHALPTRSTTQLHIQRPVSSDTPPQCYCISFHIMIPIIFFIHDPFHITLPYLTSLHLYINICCVSHNCSSPPADHPLQVKYQMKAHNQEKVQIIFLHAI